MVRRIALLATVLIAVGANATVLCTRSTGSGTVRVRETCKTNEVQLDPVSLGLQGPKGPPGTSGRGLTVHDANGEFVGSVLGKVDFPSTSGMEVLRRIDGSLVRFFVKAAGFASGRFTFNPQSLYFETTTCDGTMYWIGAGADTNEDQLSAPGDVVFESTLLYVTDRRLSVVRRMYAVGFFTDAAGCAARGGTFRAPVCCESHPEGTDQVGAPVRVFDLTTLGLVPPFHVEMEG